MTRQVNGFELNTERETVDTTTLSDEFRSRISTLMSGSGRMSCFWEYTGNTANELPNYLVELSEFTGVLTGCAVQFAPNNTVQVEADFITTGLIQLRMNLETISKALQENDSELLLEQGTDNAVLLDP